MSDPMADYTLLDGPAFLEALGDDAMKWAMAFCQIMHKQKWEIDESLMVSWFANAIEHSSDVRARRALSAPPPAVAPQGWQSAEHENADTLRAALKKIVFLRPAGAIPKQVSGALIERIEEIAITALSLPAPQGWRLTFNDGVRAAAQLVRDRGSHDLANTIRSLEKDNGMA